MEKSIKSMRGFAMSGLLWIIIGAALLWWAYTQEWAGLALAAGIVGALLLLHGLYKLIAPKHVEDRSGATGRSDGSGVDSTASSGSSGSSVGTVVAGAGAAAAATAAAAAGSAGNAAGDAVQATGSAVGNAAGSVGAAATGAAAAAGAAVAGTAAAAGAAVSGAAAAVSGGGAFVRLASLNAYRDAFPSNFKSEHPTCVRCGNDHVVAGRCQSCGTDLFTA